MLTVAVASSAKVAAMYLFMLGPFRCFDWCLFSTLFYLLLVPMRLRPEFFRDVTCDWRTILQQACQAWGVAKLGILSSVRNPLCVYPLGSPPEEAEPTRTPQARRTRLSTSTEEKRLNLVTCKKETSKGRPPASRRNHSRPHDRIRAGFAQSQSAALLLDSNCDRHLVPIVTG